MMRAKIWVREVESFGEGEQAQDRITAMAVSSKSYDADGLDEDNTYARFTPTGRVELTIANPALVGKIKVGDKFYVDFTRAEA